MVTASRRGPALGARRRRDRPRRGTPCPAWRCPKPCLASWPSRSRPEGRTSAGSASGAGCGASGARRGRRERGVDEGGELGAAERGVLGEHEEQDAGGDRGGAARLGVAEALRRALALRTGRRRRRRGPSQRTAGPRLAKGRRRPRRSRQRNQPAAAGAGGDAEDARIRGGLAEAEREAGVHASRAALDASRPVGSTTAAPRPRRPRRDGDLQRVVEHGARRALDVGGARR